MAGIYNASAKPNPNVPGKTNNAVLPNPAVMLQAGIDPKTKLPVKMSKLGEGFKHDNKKLLRILDEQDAINRYHWYNLPASLSGNLIERILYYKGQGMFFYMETDDRFYFLPYALDGTIDVYGRYVEVTPLPFNGTANDGADKDKEKPWITGLKRRCIYDIYSVNNKNVDEMSDAEIDKIFEKLDDRMKNGCVILHDYSCQQSQTNISRQILNDPLLDVMADCIPFMRTALLNSTGVMGMRVQSEDEHSNVKSASASINKAALSGEKYIPIVGAVDFQEMTGGQVSKSEEFLLAMQSLDNYRLSLYGLENGGIFQKKSHMLEGEHMMNAGKAALPMQDGLTQRQNFCNLINNVWGLGAWCEIGEAAIGIDRDLNGEIADSEFGNEGYSGGDVDNGSNDE